ncbi:WD40 repeat domain-containing protein [Streptacidiphilus monticola]|uniref:WD40 repeat domain-containing protein n=1 Tax=Streptacidiphilus monticola TaxID=2161674 RepID=A0ABW1G0F5_9ACTN
MRVQLWDLAGRQPLTPRLVGHRRTVDAVATTVVDGLPVAVTGSNFDGRLRVWDLLTGRQLGEALLGHHRRVGALATVIAPDGTPLALSGSDDSTVRAWHLRTLQPFGPPPPFPYRVTALSPTPSGDLLVAFGEELALLRLQQPLS